MAAIMSLEEPRPRGMVLGERSDRLRVGEAYHFFRCMKSTAGSMRGITYGLRTTKARCCTRCKIKRNSVTGSSARARGACEPGQGAMYSSHRAEA
jgi:hypothetical protein